MADHFLMSTNIDEAAFSLRGSIDKILKPDDTCSNNNEQPCGVREENHLVIDPTTFVSTVANSSIDPSDGAPVGDKAEDTVAKPTEIVVLDSASTEVTENDDTAVSPPAEDPQISFPQRVSTI